MQHLVRESYTVDYAGFWWRLAAVIIDGLILAGINYVMNGIWGVASGAGWMSRAVDPMAEEVVRQSGLWGIQVLVFFLVQVGYFVCFWAWRGQTPGKIICRLKITRFDGAPIGWSGAIMRYFGYIISGLMLLIGFIWVAFDSRRQGVHDKLAETYVVRIPTKREMAAWLAKPSQRSIP